MLKKPKTIVTATIIVIMLCITGYAFFPHVEEFFYKMSSGALFTHNHETPYNQYENKPPYNNVNNGESQSTTDELDQSMPPTNSFSEFYWAEIEEGKKRNYEYINRVLKNRKTVIDEAEKVEDYSCVVPAHRKYDIKYTVLDVIFSDTFEGLGISLTEADLLKIETEIDAKIRTGKWLSGGYHFAAVRIEIENGGDKTALNLHTRGFSFVFVDSTYALYDTPSIYDSLRPGSGTQIFYLPELLCGEKVQTTTVFILPMDKQFDTYKKYIEIDPNGSSTNEPEIVKMIPIDGLINAGGS